MQVQITDQIQLIAFWCAFSQILAISFQLPIFDNVAIPFVVKTLLSLILTYAFYPYIQAGLVNEVITIGADNFWYLTIFHTIAGLMVGYLVRALMLLFTSAGSIMTQQIGFSSVSYFDPNYVARIGPFETLIQWTMVILILSTGALIPMFKGVIISFKSFSPLNVMNMTGMSDFFLILFKGIFQSAFLLSTPILFSNLLLNFVMGIVARTVPQMNILMVSFVVNIGIGLLVFYAISEEFFHVAYNMYVDKLGQWFQFIS